MRAVKIVATYDEDERENIVFIGRQSSDGKLDESFESFGYVTDWTEESQSYLRYPFTMVQMENQEAIIEWGGWDFKTQTSINAFQRRIVAGEKITRREANQQWPYTVKDIIAII